MYITFAKKSGNDNLFNRAANNWWWVPVVGGFLGGVVGGLIYVCFIEMHHSSDSGGETAYQLEDIITTKAEFKANDSEIGQGNVAFSDGVTANGK